MRLSSRAAALAESETLRLFSEAARLRRAGLDVVSLLEGDPDWPAPPAALQAMRDAVAAGKTRYGASAGLAELQAAVARELTVEEGVPTAPEEVLVTNGAKQALFEALAALAGPGDEVLIPAPCWVTYPEAVKLVGATPVLVPMPGGALDPGALARAVTPRTRVLILNTPNNPTGAVYGREALAEVAALAERRDLVVLADEAYERYVYGGARHVSPAAVGARGRTLTARTFSKSFSMTGLRVGCLAGPRELVRAAARIHGHVTGNVCTPAQWGALAALGEAPAEAERRRAAFEARRDLAHSLAARLFDCAKPQGGLFVWADSRRHLGARFADTAALARHLLEEGRVAVVPGSACGQEGWLRLSFSAAEDVIREGFARLERAL